MSITDAYSDDHTSSEVFGFTFGKTGYHQMMEMFPQHKDQGVPYLAERAVRIAMIAKGQYAIDVDMATNALISALESEVPAVKE